MQPRGPALQGRTQGRALLRRGAGKIEAQQTLALMAIQLPHLQMPTQLPLTQASQQAARCGVMQGVQQQLQRCLQLTCADLRGKAQMHGGQVVLQTQA